MGSLADSLVDRRSTFLMKYSKFNPLAQTLSLASKEEGYSDDRMLSFYSGKVSGVVGRRGHPQGLAP